MWIAYLPVRNLQSCSDSQHPPIFVTSQPSSVSTEDKYWPSSAVLTLHCADWQCTGAWFSSAEEIRDSELTGAVPRHSYRVPVNNCRRQRRLTPGFGHCSSVASGSPLFKLCKKLTLQLSGTANEIPREVAMMMGYESIQIMQGGGDDAGRT